MKKRKIIIIILALVIALIITALIVNQVINNKNRNSIEFENEVVNEINLTNEIQNTKANVVENTDINQDTKEELIQEDKLKTELSELNDLVNAENIDMDAINEKLDRRITTGDYEKVEDAYKSYLRDNFDNSIQIANILNDEKITTLLTVENYESDGKDFTESKEYITNTRETLEECKAKYTEFLTEEKAMSYINDKGLDSYYTDLYKNEFIGDMSSASQDTTVQDSIDEVIGILNTSEEVLNLLSENQDSWEIDGENISFNSESLSNQYDELINSL